MIFYVKRYYPAGIGLQLHNIFIDWRQFYRSSDASFMFS